MDREKEKPWKVNKMKLIRFGIGFCLIVSSLPLLSGCAVTKIFECAGKEKLNIYNWGEYMDIETVYSFEKKYNACVNIATFDSNETAVTKIRLQSFDIVIPSEVAVQQLVSENRLSPIDWSQITRTNRDGVEKPINLETDFTEVLTQRIQSMNNELKFDYLKYGAPYFFQNITMVYNSEKISEQEMKEQQWNILRNPKYRVVMRESARDAFMVALKQLGYSVNSENPLEIKAAEMWLKEQKSIMGNKVSYLIDEVLDDIPNEIYDVGMVFSGDAVSIMSDNEKYHSYSPDVGTDILWDGMIIPKNASNIPLAHKFISHMLSYENAYLNTDAVGYTTPLKDVFEDYLASIESDVVKKGYNVIAKEKDEGYKFSIANRNLIDEAWIRVKIS